MAIRFTSGLQNSAGVIPTLIFSLDSRPQWFSEKKKPTGLKKWSVSKRKMDSGSRE